MYKLTTIIGILFLTGILAAPVMAWGPRGGGHHMMGYWGNGPGNGSGDYGNLTSEQKTKLEALDRNFYDETKDLRARLQTRFDELDNVLAGTNPDYKKAKALQNEISDLRAKLDEKRLTYTIEVRKILPDQRFGYGNGGGYGHHHMMGNYGSMMGYGGRYGNHMRGYGSGYCWD